jgi:hypothetical protein
MKHLTATIKKASLKPRVRIDNRVITLARPGLTPGGRPGTSTDLSTMFNTVARATNTAITAILLVLNMH